MTFRKEMTYLQCCPTEAHMSYIRQGKFLEHPPFSAVTAGTLTGGTLSAATLSAGTLPAGTLTEDCTTTAPQKKRLFTGVWVHSQ